MGKFIDLTGERFGRLTVIERAASTIRKNGKTRTNWKCRCDCGNICCVDAYNLRGGKQVSCGCYQAERTSAANKSHGATNTRLYRIWSAMKARCDNKNVQSYRIYGGRGITVCREWESSFEAFQTWALANDYKEDAPRGECTLDRIDFVQRIADL